MVRHGEMEVSGVVRFLHGSTILKTQVFQGKWSGRFTLRSPDATGSQSVTSPLFFLVNQCVVNRAS